MTISLTLIGIICLHISEVPKMTGYFEENDCIWAMHWFQISCLKTFIFCILFKFFSIHNVRGKAGTDFKHICLLKQSITLKKYIYANNYLLWEKKCCFVRWGKDIYSKIYFDNFSSAPVETKQIIIYNSTHIQLLIHD